MTPTSSGAIDDRARSRRARASAEVVLIGDVPVRLVPSTDAHRTALSRYTAGWSTGLGDAQIVLAFGPVQPAPPARAPDRSTNAIHVWWDGRTVHVVDESGLTGRATSERISIGGDPGAARSLDHVAAFLMSWSLTAHDRDVVHGAGLVPPDGGSVLVLGGTGAGKSTLVGAAMAHGWRVMGDDLLVVRGTRTPQACGIARAVAVPPEVAAALDGDLATLRQDPRRNRRTVPRDRLTGGFHPIRAVVVVGHGTAPAACLRQLDQRGAFEVLLGSRVLSNTPAILRRWFPRAGALSRLPTFLLEHGAAPDRRVTTARTALDELARALRSDSSPAA